MRAPTASANSNSIVFAETAAAAPRASPALNTRTPFRGGRTRIDTARSQNTTHKSSVRNSVEPSRKRGHSAAMIVLQSATRRE